ncbi:MAG: ABC transporter permease, partial [Candidatus Sericytochromatia bacterium]|nr:ABC transporter permease [Candidatus Sericytochromatia bacterium]
MLDKNIELFIAVKQLRAKWKQTTLAILSVSVGVMILICALSLTNGFEKDLVNKILGTNPHISIESALSDRILNYQQSINKLKSIDGVSSVTPAIKGQALINNGIEVKGVLVFGVDPELESKNSDWKKYIIKGNLDKKSQSGIVLGSELARKMALSIGDSIQLVTGVGTITPLKITGIFRADFYEIDVRIAYINLIQAQNIYKLPNAINTLSVKLKDPFQADQISEKILDIVPAFNVRSWLRDNKGLLSAMAMEKKVIFLVMMFIIIVAMLGIANLLVMIVLEKTMEISILRAIGASKMNISLIFLYQGMSIGISGIVFGCLSGYFVSSLLSRYPISLPSDVYIIGNLPIDMQANDFIFVSISAFVVCLFASIIPARRAVKLRPIETIRRNR